MATLGRAFVEVRADTDKFPDDVRRAIRRLNERIERDVDQSGNALGQRLATGVRQGLNQQLQRRRLRLVTTLDVSQVSLSRAEAQIAAATRDRTVNIRFNRRVLGSFLRETGRLIGLFVLGITRILADLFDFGRQIAQIFGEAFGNINRALGNASSATVTLGAAFVQLTAAAAALVAVIVLLVGVIGTLLALFVALVETAQLLLVVLPGLAGAAVASLGPLVLIFSNLGDAIEATVGEADAFRETIEGFGPSTRGVLTTLRELVQFFLGLRESLQEDFFGPVNEAIESLDANLGPAFRLGFENVAAAAGRFAAAFIELFEHPQAPTFFLNLFRLASVGFQEIGGAVVNLVAAFANLTDATFPEVEDSIEGIASIINGWADSINQLADDPNFQETLNDWQESFQTIRDLLSEILEFVGNVVDGFRDDGIPVVESITELFEDLNEFFESEAGEEFFDGLRVSAELFLLVLEGMVVTLLLTVTLLGIIDEIITENINGGLEDLQENFGPLLGSTNIWIELLQTSNDIWEAILVIVAGVPLILGRVLSRLAEAIGSSRTFRDILRRARQFVRDIREAVGDFLDRLRDAVSRSSTLRSVFSGISFWAQQVRDFLFGALENIREILNIARSFGNTALAAVGAGLGALRPVADGGIFVQPTRALIGEAGPEVVIPLSRPQRARELVEQSGLTDLIRGGDGASVATPGGAFVPQRTILEFRSDGSQLGELLLEVLQRAIRIRGGDVQVVLGTG